MLEIIGSDGNTYINGVKPKVTAELPPWRKPYAQRGSRVMGYLERQGITKLKPEWGATILVVHEPAIQGLKPGLTADAIRAANRP